MIGIDIKVSSRVPDIGGILDNWITRSLVKIKARMKQKLHEPKRGRLYVKKRGAGFVRAHRASAPGEAPATDTYALENSIQIQKGTLEGAIFSNLDYSEILEDKMKRPLWEAT